MTSQASVHALADRAGRSPFDRVPVPIWREDFSAAAAWLAELRDAGVTDPVAHLLADRTAARHGMSLVTVLDANQAVAELVGVEDRTLLIGPLDPALITDSSIGGFVRQFEVIWRGGSRLQVDIDGTDATGAEKRYSLNWTARVGADGQPDYSDVIVALNDVTAERRMTERLGEEASLLALLIDSFSRINTRLDATELCQQLATEAAAIMGGTCSMVCLVDHDQRRITHIAGEGVDPADLAARTYDDLEAGITGWVWQNGRATVVADIDSDGSEPAAVDDDTDAPKLMAAPLSIDGVVVGTLTIRADSEGSRFAEDHLQHLEMLANHAAVTLHNSLLYEDSVAAHEELQRTQASLLAAQKLESIGSLAAGVAHEINTPMQYIGDNLTFLADCLADLTKVAETAEKLVAGDGGTSVDDVAAAIEAADLELVLEEAPLAADQAMEGVSRVRDIVRALKEFSHPGADELADVDINQAITTTLTVAKSEYKHVAALELDLAEDLGMTKALAGPFNQVILNIVVNAAHAIGDRVAEGAGQGTIAITTRREDEFTLIRIADTGGGIPAEIRDRIFDPFFTTKEVGKGTGQGLAIAWSVIVDQHKGRMDVSVDEGVGTTFEIRIPR